MADIETKLEEAKEDGFRLRRRFRKLRREALAANRPANLDITGILNEVVALTEKINTLCLKDRLAYLENQRQLKDGQIDATLQQLEQLTSGIYQMMESREERITKRLTSSQKTESDFNELTDDMQELEKRVVPLRKALEEQHAQELQDAEKSRKDAEEKAKYAKAAQKLLQQQQRDMEDKRRVNSSFWDGLTSGSDKFDLLYSMGINRDSTDQMDEGRVRGFEYLRDQANEEVKEAAQSLQEARKAAKSSKKQQERLANLLKKMQSFKGVAIEAINKLESVESEVSRIKMPLTELRVSLQNCQAQRTRPTILEMSKKLLPVVEASIKYKEFEPSVVEPGRKIFDILNSAVNWDEVFENEEDDTLKTEFEGLRAGVIAA